MHPFISRILDDYDHGRLSRRQAVAHLAGLTTLGLAAGTHASAPESTFKATDLNHLALRVTDIPRSRDFYMKHLGLTVASESERSCFLRCSEHNFVALFKADKPAMDHYCYSITEYDPAAVVEKLKTVGIEPRRRADRVYFDDPDGLEVQVAARTHSA